jgi:hypothetical protein
MTTTSANSPLVIASSADLVSWARSIMCAPGPVAARPTCVPAWGRVPRRRCCRHERLRRARGGRATGRSLPAEDVLACQKISRRAGRAEREAGFVGRRASATLGCRKRRGARPASADARRGHRCVRLCPTVWGLGGSAVYASRILWPLAWAVVDTASSAADPSGASGRPAALRDHGAGAAPPVGSCRRPAAARPYI